MLKFRFRCHECGASYAEDEVRLTCPICSELQEPGGSLRGVLEVELDTLPERWPKAPFTSAEFLTAFLPVAAEHLAPLEVGGTPLLPATELRRHLGMPRLWLKDDARNPSGSTKDRASLLVAAKARQYGYGTIAAASTGNAATALAAVTAAAGTQAVVFVPQTAPEAKLIQMMAYGARVLPVEGTYDDAFELCLEACETLGWYNRNTGLNPFTIEGKKTAALEIAASMAPECPDAVVVTTGDGVIISGVAKGFADLERAGLIPRRPRLITVQPEGSNAIVEALEHGDIDVTPVPGAASVADSLVVEVPRNARYCLEQIRASQGAGVAVSDDAIVEAIARLARLSGVFAEPGAAAPRAGRETAHEAGLVETGERVVLLITGTGLKDVPAAARAITRPAPIPPRLDALRDRLACEP
ncbi:MAG: threonine synthase [Acidobacteriota bacterium]